MVHSGVVGTFKPSAELKLEPPQADISSIYTNFFPRRVCGAPFCQREDRKVHHSPLPKIFFKNSLVNRIGGFSSIFRPQIGHPKSPKLPPRSLTTPTPSETGLRLDSFEPHLTFREKLLRTEGFSGGGMFRTLLGSFGQVPWG